MNLSLVYQGMGRYDDAFKVLAAVRPRSQDWIPAQNRLGLVHWLKSRMLDGRGDSAGASAEAQKALESLNVALKARKAAGTGAADPGYIGNIGDIATVLAETGKPTEALAVLDPVIKAQTVKTGRGYAMLLESQLKALILTGQVDPAIAAIKALEQAGGSAGRAQLYFKLGRLLEKELENLRAKKNTKALASLTQSYRTVLNTLVDSKTGQTYESLDWAGTSLRDLDAYADAEKVFRRMLNDYSQDAQFLQQTSAKARMTLIRIKLASALRGQKKFDEANSLLDEVLEQKPPYLDALIEKGLLLESEAEAGKGKLGRRHQALGRSHPAHGALAAAATDLLRGLVSRGLGTIQTEKHQQGPPGLDGCDAAFPRRRRRRDEGEIPGPARPAQVIGQRREKCQRVFATASFAVSSCQVPSRTLMLVCGKSFADDVNLVTGAKFEQAIGGRVRGQVQSESATEVVVQLGANTTKVPTELIQSIRYDGQSGIVRARRGTRIGRPDGRGGRVFQEGRRGIDRQAVPAASRLVSRGRGLDRPGGRRARPHQGSEGKTHQLHPGLSEQPPHPERAARAWRESNWPPATSPPPRRPSTS